MRLRLILCLLLLLITPVFAREDPPSVIYIHAFNPTTTPFSLGPADDIHIIEPNQTTTFALPPDGVLVFNEGILPLEDIYTIYGSGNRYLFVYTGDDAYTVYNPSQMEIAYTQYGHNAEGDDKSVWWIGNYLTDPSAVLTVSVKDEVILNLAYGDIGGFSAPIKYFDITFSVGDMTLFSSNQAFGEPYYTSVVVFAGDYTGRMGTDYVPMVLDLIETDFITWLDALTQAKIAPYEYQTMLMLIADAGMEAEFLADDRVILLPYDDAFLAQPIDVRSHFFNDDARLNQLLMNHLLVQSDIPTDPEASLTTLAGEILPVTRGRMGLRIGDAGYITRLLLPNLSEVWLIDWVLLPTGDGG